MEAYGFGLGLLTIEKPPDCEIVVQVLQIHEPLY
jgi:hypothetical protein